MASSAAKLIVEIIATTAQFQSDLGKASAAAEQHARKIDQAFAGLKNSVSSHLVGIAGSLGVALSVAGIIAWGKSIIEASEQLRNLSVETGSTVEDLSRLQNIARISGVSFDTFRETLDRLAAGIGGAEQKGTRIGEVLKLLGITAKDPAKALQELANQLNKYGDNASKAALLQSAFRLSGVQLADMFKHIAESSGVAATRTAEQAKTAAELAEKTRALQVQFHLFSDVLLNEVAPSLTRILEQFTEGIRIAGDFVGALRLFGTLNPFKSTQSQIDDLTDTLERLKKAKSPGEDFLAGLGITPFRVQEIADITKKLQFLKVLRDQELGNLDFLNKDRSKPKPNAPQLPPVGLEKALLEAALRRLDLYITSEQDLLRQREAFLADYYKEDQLGIEDYFSRRAAVSADALLKERAALDQEEALIRARIGKAKPTERAEEEKLLADVIGKRSKIEQDAAAASVKAYLEQGRALKDFRDKVEELGIAEAESRGDPTAAAARFDFERRQIIERLNLEKESSNEIVALQARIGLAAVGQLRARSIAQDALNRAQANFATISGDIANAQSRIDLAVSTGNATEIEGLNARSALAVRYIAILQRQADEAEKALAGLKGQELADALLGVDSLRLRIEQLASQTDLLGKKFRDVFVTSFTDAIEQAVTGTKKPLQILLDLGKAVEQQITRIAAQNISETVFGKGGALGGIPDFFAGLFGGKGAAGTPANPALISNTTALDLLTLAVEANTAAQGARGAASAADGFPFGSFFDTFGGEGFATGTNFAPGGLALVGERGAEVVNLPRGSQVIPNDVLVSKRGHRGGGHTYNTFHINVMPGATRASAEQAAAAVAREVQRARRVS